MDDPTLILCLDAMVTGWSFTMWEVLNIIREFCVRGRLADVSMLIGVECVTHLVLNSAQLFC
jgi:hypothetical protein